MSAPVSEPPASILNRGCGLCGHTKHLLLCSRCKVISYCNREHQTAHRSTHKVSCNAIGKTQAKMEIEQRKMRIGLNGSPVFTPEFLEASVQQLHNMKRVNTSLAVGAGLQQTMLLLFLDPTDKREVLDFLPGFLLRLNRDQEAYEFAKLHHMPCMCTGQEHDHPVEDAQADVFEDTGLLPRSSGLSELLSVTLLKVKLLLDLTELELHEHGKRHGCETISDAHLRYGGSGDVRSILRSPLTKSIDTSDQEKSQQLRSSLTTHFLELFYRIKRMNPHLWEALASPEANTRATRPPYPPGSLNEAKWVSYVSYDAWAETPGALSLLSEPISKGSVRITTRMTLANMRNTMD